MGQSRRNQLGKWVSVFGCASAIAVAAGAAIYYLISSSEESDEHEKFKMNKPSRCIVVTESVAASKTFDWSNLLTEDVVLLVCPGIHFAEESTKVIRCDTMVGVWSCVRHLKKDQLLLEKPELGESIPDDIPRYVKECLDVSCLQNL